METVIVRKKVTSLPDGVSNFISLPAAWYQHSARPRHVEVVIGDIMIVGTVEQTEILKAIAQLLAENDLLHELPNVKPKMTKISSNVMRIEVAV